jgi:hypothetical protein
VKLVVSDSCDREGLRRQLDLKFREALGEGVAVNLLFVPAIVTRPGEKRRLVVSLCRQDKQDSRAPSDR